MTQELSTTLIILKEVLQNLQPKDVTARGGDEDMEGGTASLRLVSQLAKFAWIYARESR